jgi:DNA-binding NarL/FixJ family response regulator
MKNKQFAGLSMKSGKVRLKVVLADDHARILECVTGILSDHYEIVAAVDNGRKAVDAILRFSPEIAILDIGMPELDGFSVARELKELSSNTKIIFLTVFGDENDVSEAFDVGASAFVLKSCMQSDLLNAIKHALAGERFVSSNRWTAGTPLSTPLPSKA